MRGCGTAGPWMSQPADARPENKCHRLEKSFRTVVVSSGLAGGARGEDSSIEDLPIEDSSLEDPPIKDPPIEDPPIRGPAD